MLQDILQAAAFTFGSFTLNNTNTGNFDLFLVKYDTNGNVLWAKKAGGMSDEVPFGICIDAGGKVVVTGKFHSSVMDFGSFTITNHNSANYDLFVSRWDVNGNPLWARDAGGNLLEIGKSVSSSGGNIFVAGYYASDTMHFGTSYLLNADPGNENVFVAKYDTAGTVQYEKSFYGHDVEYANGITADASGNVFVTGEFRSDTIHIGSFILTDANSYDFFVAKLDASGNALWAHSAASGTDDVGYGIANDGSGNIYLTGNYGGSSITFGTTTLTNTGGAKLFVVKYDSNGNVLWAIQSGGISSGPAGSSSVAAFGVDNVCIAGTYTGANYTLGNVSLNVEWTMGYVCSTYL